MNTLKLSKRTESPVLRCAAPLVFVDGRFRPDLRGRLWEVLPAPRFGRARLEVRGRAVLPPPRIGSHVLLLGPGAVGQFLGVVDSRIDRLGEQADPPGVEVRHILAEKLSDRVAARHLLIGGEPVEIRSGTVGFNTGCDSMATPNDHTLNGRKTPLFSSAADARRWSVADALAYLLAACVPPEVEVQDIDELRELAGGINAGESDITGRTVAEALANVAAAAALELRAARAGEGLVFYRPGRQGRLRSVRLQPSGQRVLASGSNLWRGRLEFHRRPGRRGVLALGARRRYEATFELSPGWDPAKQTHRWRDFVRGEAADWPDVSRVYRKWVLNEHARYSGEPWNLPVHDFSEIDPYAFTALSPRRFLPCISTDEAGQSLGMAVEFRRGGEDQWRRWPGPVWTCEDECAVLLGGDSLPGDFFAAAAAGEAQVRITATVQADARLIAEVPGDPNLPTETADFSDRAAWQRVSPLSVFYGRGDLGVPDERDDADMLAELARRHAEGACEAVEAHLTLGWPDASFHVGDRVERIDGRAIELAPHADAAPRVRSVRHDFDRLTTELTVTG